MTDIPLVDIKLQFIVAFLSKYLKFDYSLLLTWDTECFRYQMWLLRINMHTVKFKNGTILK